MTSAYLRKTYVFFEDFAHVMRDSNKVATDSRGLWMLTSGEYEDLHRDTRVVHIPFRTALTGVNDAPRIAENNILFVLSAGNTYSSANRRDLWSKEHPLWQGDDVRYYNNALVSRKTGKVIAATSARETENGDILPMEQVFGVVT